MKLAVVAMSDPHVGRTWSSYCTPATRDLLRDRYLDPIKELTEEHITPMLICGGDWFDKPHNSERVIEQSLPLLACFDAVIAGNHDHSGRESAVTSLGLIDGLGVAEGLIRNDHHLNDPVFRVSGHTGIMVYSVPHHGTQDLFEQACLAAASHARNAGWPALLMLHANVGSIGGGKPDSCLYLTPQLQSAVEEPFDFILCGHEHLPSQQGKLIVMGSTNPCNFGELGPRFFWGFELDEETRKVTAHRLPIASQLKHAIIDVAKQTIPAVAPELIKLVGKVPLSQARQVQSMVRAAYAAGALAVKVEVEFDKGRTVDGGEVAGSMANLVDVIRTELSDNRDWLDLFNEALAAETEGKV